MRKVLACILLGLGMLALPAIPAAAAPASGWYYTGYWYYSPIACELGYQRMVGNNQGDLPHQCRLDAVGVYELWRMS